MGAPWSLVELELLEVVVEIPFEGGGGGCGERSCPDRRGPLRRFESRILGQTLLQHLSTPLERPEIAAPEEAHTVEERTLGIVVSDEI